jgi:putative ABC transport system permease protein
MADWIPAFRSAARSLRRQPTFVIVALLTLTLGIGANTAIFSVIRAVVLNPLPYDEPERIAVLWEVNPEGSLDRVSVPAFEDWKADARAFDAVAAYRHVDFTFAGAGDPQSVPGVRATPELFAVLSADAAIGRTFGADEGIFGRDKVVVLADGFWRRALGANSGIIGRTIMLDAEPYTVVGVMPPAFQFPTAADAQLWVPLAFNPKDLHGRSRRARSLLVIGRIGREATIDQAQAEMSGLASRIAREHPDSNEGWGVRAVAAHEQLVASSRPALMVLMGAVGFLLLIVCANMANLLLARISSRRRELAVRAALGAGRWEVAKPFLAESLLLSAAGGVFGTAAAFGGLRLLARLPEARLPRIDQVQLDGGVFAFAMGVSLLVGLGFGLVPALQAFRTDLRETLNETAGTSTPGGRRVLSALVVVEVALALVLLVGAGLMTRSFVRLLQVDPGFEPSNVLAARVALPATKYRERHRLIQFYEEALDRLRRSSGVRSASAVSLLPLQEATTASALPFAVEGRTPPPSEDPLAEVRIVAPGYFETLGIALKQGRLLDDRDGDTSPRTSVINETMARRYFPDRSPLGQIIVNPHGKSTVVGVVADVRNQGLASEPKKQVYLPMRQSPSAAMALVARTERDPMALAGAMQRIIWDVDPEQPLYDVSTMDGLVARAVFLPRLSATLLAAFALAALLLAVLGIYGVLSYSVVQRTREIGLRMALGATGGRTVGLVVRHSLLMIVLGVGGGLIAAGLLARSLAGVLYGVSPFDLPAFVTAALVLVTAGGAAAAIPAFRATHVDPLVALREP